MVDVAEDEVKVFRKVEEDAEEEAPSLADDRKDVAMEEEIEQKANITGLPNAYANALNSPAFSQLYNYMQALSASPSFNTTSTVNPALYLMQMNAMQQQHQQQTQQQQQALNVAATMNYLASQSPVFQAARMFAAISPSYNAMMMGGGAPGSPLAYSKFGMMGVPLPPTSAARPLNQLPMNVMGHHMMPGMSGGGGGGHHHHHHHPTPRRTKKEKDEHVKKPMNAFMWFMKENRPILMLEPEFKEKQSAELNKELGRRWQGLPKDQQEKYYELAKADKEDHAKRHPNWTARENYAIHKKNKKKKRDRSATESGEAKKCRAKFGVNAQDKWCAPCRRKKKCQYVCDDVEEMASSHSTHSLHQRASDSDAESEMDDDPMITNPRELDGVGEIKMEAL